MSVTPTIDTLPALRPGDCLIYAPHGMFGWLIAAKTWHASAHVEGYLGDGQSVASRDGQGVNIYPLRLAGLIRILRPREFGLPSAMRWFEKRARGQAYDWWGLLRFTWGHPYTAGGTNNKMFCSEFLTRWYRAGGIDPFHDEDADAIAPFQFDLTPAFDRVWSASPAAAPEDFDA